VRTRWRSAHASQTASQSVRRRAIIWVHPRTSLTRTATSSCAKEITDTKEVTGSNPVSPTSIFPSRGPVFGSRCSFTARYTPVSSGDFDP
jgi:hypothetical protein